MEKRIIITNTANYKIYSENITVESIICMIDGIYKCFINKIHKNDGKTSTEIIITDSDKTRNLLFKRFNGDVNNTDIFDYVENFSSMHQFESVYSAEY